MNNTEIIQLQPADSQAIALVTGNEWVRAEWAAEQWARYEAACNAGLILHLCHLAQLHGTLEASVRRWLVTADDVSIEVCYFLNSGVLKIVRNGELCVSDLISEFVFDVGQGRFLEALLLEHSRLERAIAQDKRLAERLELNAAAQRRARNI